MNEFSISLNGVNILVSLSENGSVIVNDKNYSFEITPLDHSEFVLKLDNKIYHIHYSPVSQDNYNITVDGKHYELTIRTALQERAAKLIEQTIQKSTSTQIKAPMPGMVLKIKKSIADIVVQGEPLMILEAMKMENELKSPVSGTITNIYISEGNPVEKGALLFTID